MRSAGCARQRCQGGQEVSGEHRLLQNLMPAFYRVSYAPSTEDDTSVKLITPQWPAGPLLCCSLWISDVTFFDKIRHKLTRFVLIHLTFWVWEGHFYGRIGAWHSGRPPRGARPSGERGGRHDRRRSLRWRGRHSHAGDVEREPPSPSHNPDVSFPSIHQRSFNDFTENINPRPVRATDVQDRSNPLKKLLAIVKNTYVRKSE